MVCSITGTSTIAHIICVRCVRVNWCFVQPVGLIIGLKVVMLHDSSSRNDIDEIDFAFIIIQNELCVCASPHKLPVFADTCSSPL